MWIAVSGPIPQLGLYHGAELQGIGPQRLLGLCTHTLDRSDPGCTPSEDKPYVSTWQHTHLLDN